jgi:uncharacterized membrane protein YfcA
MDLTTTSLLAAAGVVGGLVNAIAGGATLITFPTMLYVGLPPVIANASNAVAISPGHLLAAIADRERLPRADGRLILLLLAAAVGAALGAVLLLAIPERWFVLPVPVLIAFATALFAFAPRIQRWAAQRRGSDRFSPMEEASVLGAVSIYGGFFGAGLGVILAAMLAITDPGDIRAVKVLKNLLASVVSLVAVVIFIAQDVVSWPETTVMLLGAIVGGYLGGLLIRVWPAWLTRCAVVAAGAAMTVVYAIRYWF